MKGSLKLNESVNLPFEKGRCPEGAEGSMGRRLHNIPGIAPYGND